MIKWLIGFIDCPPLPPPLVFPASPLPHLSYSPTLFSHLSSSSTPSSTSNGKNLTQRPAPVIHLLSLYDEWCSHENCVTLTDQQTFLRWMNDCLVDWFYWSMSIKLVQSCWLVQSIINCLLIDWLTNYLINSTISNDTLIFEYRTNWNWNYLRRFHQCLAFPDLPLFHLAPYIFVKTHQNLKIAQVGKVRKQKTDWSIS